MTFRKKILIAFCFIINASLTAQTDKHQLSLSYGVAFPFNDFSQKELSDSAYSGFAKTGQSLNLTFGYQMTKSFGIVSSFLANFNSVDNQMIKQGVIQSETNSDQTRSVLCQGDAGNWKTAMLLVGPMINFGNRPILIEIRCLLGAGFGKSPTFHYTITEHNSDISMLKIREIKQPSDHAFAFAWDLGASFKYFFDRLFVRLNIDYSLTKFNFKEYNLFDRVVASDAEITGISLPTEIMQLTLGIGCRF